MYVHLTSYVQGADVYQGPKYAPATTTCSDHSSSILSSFFSNVSSAWLLFRIANILALCLELDIIVN